MSKIPTDTQWTDLANKINSKQTATNSKIYYGTCPTEAPDVAKIVTSSGFVLELGAHISVKFTYGNNRNGATLNVNNTGAKTITYVGSDSNTANQWGPGEVIDFVYDGSHYVMVRSGVASSSYYGLTKLTDSVSSTSSASAATANAVKTAYDLANTKIDKAGVLDIFYPVGTYYETSDTSFDPNTAWGGTWVEDSAGRVTVAKNTATFATVGNTGGEETHTLTTTEMPSHRHVMTRPRWWGNDPSIGHAGSIYGQTNSTTAYGEEPSGSGITHYAVSYAGGGGSHNNLQPYVVVKRWHRTA